MTDQYEINMRIFRLLEYMIRFNDDLKFNNTVAKMMKELDKTINRTSDE